jgi:DNA-binding MarR family transcriptional regulator
MNLNHPTTCLTSGLMRLTRALNKGFDQAAAGLGMTSSQFTTLATLSGWGEMSVGDLATALGTDRTTLTRNMGVMQARGWVALVDSQDRRARVWALTDGGRVTLNAAMPIWQSWQAGLVDRLGPGGAVRFLETLKTLEKGG